MALNFRGLFGSKPPSSAPSPQVQDLYAEATRAYEAKDFSRAVPLYEQVIALQPDHAEACYKRGNALKNLGQLEAALASYDAAIERKPDFPYVWCNRGTVQQSLGSYEAALASFVRAIELDPADVIAHSNRAALLLQTSRWQEALASYDQLLALNPQLFQVWFQRGNVLKALGQPEPALASYREALRLNPDYAEAHYNHAVLLEQVRQPHAALASYDRAIELLPQFHQAHYNRAGLLKADKRLDAALAAYDRAIAVKPDYSEAHANRGVVLQEQQRWDEALASYDRAIMLRPDYAECYLNRGTLFGARQQWEAALDCCNQALALRSGYAQGHFERARVLTELGRLEAALAEYERSLAIKPDFADAQYNRALALLSCGDYPGGWASYESRWANAEKLSLAKRTFSQPLWLGQEPLCGKRLLVYNEQGLGDTLQFCRFVKSVADLGGSVILQVQKPLVSVLESLEGVSSLIAEDAPLPDFDYQCPLMSLPLALRTTLDTIPGAGGYLRSDPVKVAAWHARLGERSRPRIGLVWSGNPRQGNDHNRSFPLASWINQLPRDFQYVCLQKDIRAVDEATLVANPWISRYDSELQNFGDTAALCACLDVVISVCTSVAHLSAALGRPTWVLLPFNADWRWLLGRDDSPWYRSVKLYRQEAIADWSGVFGRVASDLRKLT